MTFKISEDIVDTYDRDGVTVLRNVLDRNTIEIMRQAFAEIVENPSDRGASFNEVENTGCFFGDIWMWRRHKAFKDFEVNSVLPDIAAKLMKSKAVFLGWDQLFLKEPNTPLITPWHQDQPYAWIEGMQNVNFWVPLDFATTENGVLEFVKGSHKWPYYAAVKFQPSGGSWNNPDLKPMPDIESHREDYDIVSWELSPGDVLVHHLNILHYANGNLSDDRRRAIAVRYVGDDATYAVRKDGPPILFEPGLDPGDPIECELFPKIRPA